MQLIFVKGAVKIDMSFYVKKVLSDYGDVVSTAIPAQKDLFMVDEKSKVLKPIEAKGFHTTVARLLYLSRRGCPDIITVVGFLCTRIKAPTVQDQKKLMQVLGYLQQTVNYILTLRPKKMVQVEAYIDTSYATHVDGKLHSGLIVKIGGVVVFCASRKQKCVSKAQLRQSWWLYPIN
jgi:hypothetical protein